MHCHFKTDKQAGKKREPLEVQLLGDGLARLEQVTMGFTATGVEPIALYAKSRPTRRKLKYASPCPQVAKCRLAFYGSAIPASC